jgi:hypothetical protein
MTAGGEDAFIQTVRLRIPRAYLPILGVPIIDPDAEGTVVVEVLVNEEGLGRGVRILQ